MARFHAGAWAAGIRSAVRPLAVRGLDLAGRAMVAEIKGRLSVPGPEHSAPGESPRYQTGGLYNSISHEVDPVNLRVYVIADHPAAYYLEFGTHDLAPRPFMRRGLAAMAQGEFARWVSVAFAAPRTPKDPSTIRYGNG